MLFTSSLLSCLPQDEYAATPLITACGENKFEVVKFLIENAANINYQTKVFDINFCFCNLFIIHNILHHRRDGHLSSSLVTVVIQILSTY